MILSFNIKSTVEESFIQNICYLKLKKNQILQTHERSRTIKHNEAGTQKRENNIEETKNNEQACQLRHPHTCKYNMQHMHKQIYTQP